MEIEQAAEVIALHGPMFGYNRYQRRKDNIYSLDGKETNKHFAGQAIYDIVKSCSDQPGANMVVLEPCSTSSAP